MLRLAVFDFDLTLSSHHCFYALSGGGGSLPVPPPYARSERGQLRRLVELDGHVNYARDGGVGVAVLGGPARVTELRGVLDELRLAGVECLIISKSLVAPVRFCLRRAGLLAYFTRVYANLGEAYGESEYDVALRQAAPQLSVAELELMGTADLGGWVSKKHLIEQLLAERGLARSEAVFIDDSIEEIRHVEGTCGTILVETQGGMGPNEFMQLRALFSRHAASLASQLSPTVHLAPASQLERAAPQLASAVPAATEREDRGAKAATLVTSSTRSTLLPAASVEGPSVWRQCDVPTSRTRRLEAALTMPAAQTDASSAGTAPWQLNGVVPADGAADAALQARDRVTSQSPYLLFAQREQMVRKADGSLRYPNGHPAETHDPSSRPAWLHAPPASRFAGAALGAYGDDVDEAYRPADAPWSRLDARADLPPRSAACGHGLDQPPLRGAYSRDERPLCYDDLLQRQPRGHGCLGAAAEASGAQQQQRRHWPDYERSQQQMALNRSHIEGEEAALSSYRLPLDVYQGSQTLGFPVGSGGLGIAGRGVRPHELEEEEQTLFDCVLQ